MSTAIKQQDIRGPWLALQETAPADTDWVEEWDDVAATIRQVVELLPTEAPKELVRDLGACANLIARNLAADDPFAAAFHAETVLITLRGALSETTAGRYRAALLQLRRLLQEWWEQQDSKLVIYAMGQEPDHLADLPHQAVEAAMLGLPIKGRRKLREELTPRLTRQLRRWHQRDEEQREWLERVRTARADEVMARRKLGLPEEGTITAAQIEEALERVRAGEPDAHPTRKRRWQQAASNLLFLTCLEETK